MVGNMRFDRVKIGKIISDIKKYQRDLEELRIASANDLRRKDKFYISSILIFSIVNAAVDLGNEIIAAKKLELPSSYKEVFDILANRGIIDRKTKDALIELVRIRNAIAHRYFVVTSQKLFDSIKKLVYVNKLVNKIKKLVK
jgi:uncharacterized protein YutE (UPF0331/DUF86 family)